MKGTDTITHVQEAHFPDMFAQQRKAYTFSLSLLRFTRKKKIKISAFWLLMKMELEKKIQNRRIGMEFKRAISGS